jgi:hypothetical protein
MKGLNLEFALQLQASLDAIANAAKRELTPEEQREKELRDAYNRGYRDGQEAANNYSWRV